MTAYVLAGLSQAKAAGFDVKQDAIDKGRGWLLPQFDQSQKVQTDLRAYMAYALVESGVRETGVHGRRLAAALHADAVRAGDPRPGDARIE